MAERREGVVALQTTSGGCTSNRLVYLVEIAIFAFFRAAFGSEHFPRISKDHVQVVLVHLIIDRARLLKPSLL